MPEKDGNEDNSVLWRHPNNVPSPETSIHLVDREGRYSIYRITHIIFSRRGREHGAGLCQAGAFLMARKGATYQEILKTYYRGVTIEKRI